MKKTDSENIRKGSEGVCFFVVFRISICPLKLCRKERSVLSGDGASDASIEGAAGAQVCRDGRARRRRPPAAGGDQLVQSPHVRVRPSAACGSGCICVRIRARGRRCGMPDVRLAHQLSRGTHARGLVRRHLNPLLETGFSRPILFEDLPPLAAHDRADSVRQVPRVRAPGVFDDSNPRNRRRNADQNRTFL